MLEENLRAKIIIATIITYKARIASSGFRMTYTIDEVKGQSKLHYLQVL